MRLLAHALGRLLPRFVLAATVIVVSAVVAPRCTNSGAADGTPCTSPFQCSSGFCIQRSTSISTCGHVCVTSGDCTGGDVCGAFDFAEPDEAGAPDPSSSDTVMVCRPSLAVPCSLCSAASCLSVASSDAGVCSTPCALNTDCPNNLCILPVGRCEGLCAPPCDTIAECPQYFLCDTVDTDMAGHGRCIPNSPDAGFMPASTTDAACGVDP